MKRIIIAIDGYSSCGKSTMAKALAREIGYIYIDTGAMYRAVTLFALQNGLFSADGESLNEQRLQQLMPQISVGFSLDPASGKPLTTLNGHNVESQIRSLDVSQRVSRVAALPFVRASLTEQQRNMGRAKGIVMDGRDIGTNVFPQAELKIFVTADAGVRARRRFDELAQKGQPATLEEIKQNILSRDYTDTHRAVSPLRRADDAIVLDNSHMTPAQQDKWLLEQVNRLTRQG